MPETLSERAKRLLNDAQGAVDSGDFESAAEIAANALLSLNELVDGDPVAVAGAAPSLPVGGDDGRRWEITICPTCDRELLLTLPSEIKSGGCCIGTNDAPHPFARGVRQLVAPVSPSAGDEAREAPGTETRLLDAVGHVVNENLGTDPHGERAAFDRDYPEDAPFVVERRAVGPWVVEPSGDAGGETR